jgi:hypothetical protein
MGKKRNVCEILVEKPERERPVGRPRPRWVDNIKMSLREKGWGGMNWINVIQDRDQWRALVNIVMNLWVAQNSGKFLSSCITGDLSRSTQIHIVCLLTTPYWETTASPY